MDGKPKKQFKPDSVKVLLNFAKHHTDTETLVFVNKHFREAIRNG